MTNNSQNSADDLKKDIKSAVEEQLKDVHWGNAYEVVDVILPKEDEMPVIVSVLKSGMLPAKLDDQDARNEISNKVEAAIGRIVDLKLADGSTAADIDASI